jgi:ligand-binding sensor domain-containing protein
MIVRTPGEDTLKALEKVPYKSLVVSLRAGTSKKMSGLRHKENARIDLQYFNSESGLPSSYTNALLFTKEGIMWIGTSKGLCRFDGNIVTTYTSDDGLPDDLITRLFEDAQGNIWIGTQYGGVAKYDGYSLTILNDENGLPANSVTGIDQDSKGNIWIGMWGGGVSKFDGKTIETIGRENGLFEMRVTHLILDKSDKVWIATNGGGVYTYDGKSLHVQNDESRLGDFYLTQLMIDSKDRLWTGNWTNLKYIQNDSSYLYRFQNVEYGIPTTSIFEDSKGNIWFTSMSGGAVKYRDTEAMIFTELSGLPSNKVNAVCEDPFGNIWFATDGGGLCRYNPNSFNYYDESSGLNSKAVNAIAEMKDGQILFATDNGLVFFNDTSFNQMYFRTNQNLQTGRVYDVHVASDSSVWFTVLNNSVYRLHQDSVRVIGRWQGIHDHNVTAIQERVDGELWFGAWNVGLSRLKDEQFYVFNARSGLHNFVITDLISDDQQNLWIATDGEGITKYDGTYFTHITENEGLTDNHINSFYEDSYNNIWVLSKRGIDIIENGEIKKFPQKNLLPDQDVVSLVEDRDGNYWIFTANGLLYLKKKENVNSKTWQISNYVPKRFTQFDGLIGMDFIPRSVFIDSKNRIWFGSGKGLMMKNLSSFDVTPKIPEISLQTIKLNGHAIDYNNLFVESYDSLFSDFESLKEGIGKPEKFKNLPASLILPPDVNHLNFMFSALSWNSDKILFSYKLVGVDENWSQPSKDTWAEYRNLSYGDYAFQLKGIGESEVESPILEYHFTILPPWYHTWWARILFLVLIILGVRFVVRLRTRQLELKQVQLENKVLERTAELDVKNRSRKTQRRD